MKGLGAGVGGNRKELHSVLELQVLAPPKRLVLFHGLDCELDVETREAADATNDQVPDVAAEFVEDGDLVRRPQIKLHRS